MSHKLGPMLLELGDQIERIKSERDWYRSRVKLLEQSKAMFREPELTIVCDILANGQLLPDPNGARYGNAAKPEAQAAADFRLAQLTRALHIAQRAITGNDALAMNAKSIVKHAIETHGVKGELWKLSPAPNA